MASVSQNGSNGKLILTTVVVSDPAEFDSILNLPDVSDDLHSRVQRGDVETGSPWDGWPLERIYEVRIRAGDHPDTAASMVDSIMLNRYYHARKAAGDSERDAGRNADELAEYARIEATLMGLEFDPVPGFWEVE